MSSRSSDHASDSKFSKDTVEDAGRGRAHEEGRGERGLRELTAAETTTEEKHRERGKEKIEIQKRVCVSGVREKGRGGQNGSEEESNVNKTLVTKAAHACRGRGETNEQE